MALSSLTLTPNNLDFDRILTSDADRINVVGYIPPPPSYFQSQLSMYYTRLSSEIQYSTVSN